MKLIKWIDRPTILMDEVNHWLDSLSVDTPINFYNKSTSWVPQFEVREIDDSYQIFAELPGMNKKDINVEVVDGNLTISGEKSNSDADKKHYFCQYLSAFAGSLLRTEGILYLRLFPLLPLQLRLPSIPLPQKLIYF